MDELVSCIMSQHTTDANSFPAFTRLRETFPEWQDMVDAGPERVADVIRDAGLANAKSKNIVNCLLLIHQRTGAFSLDSLRSMPTNEATKWLLELPGVGPKTAAIVLCFAMGRGTIPVDTHVYRVSWRLGFVPEGVGEGKAQAILEQLVPSDLSFRYHTALIQHGRTICKAPTPLCDRCPVSSNCWWFSEGRYQADPKKRSKKTPSQVKN
jgi:endonuclease-3